MPGFSQAFSLGREQGRAPLRQRGTVPQGHSSFTFHWCWNSPQGSARKGSGYFGNRIHLVQLSLSAEPALELVPCFLRSLVRSLGPAQEQ